MTTAEAKKWFTDAGAFKGTGITTTDLDIQFTAVVKKRDKAAKNMTEADVDALCTVLGKKYKGGKDALLCKLNGAESKMHGVTKQSATGNVDKMTDTSTYTGSHKERFDESGKGKGAAGRSDIADNSGYVGNYKGEGTYDKSH